jgi:hypothetical protein
VYRSNPLSAASVRCFIRKPSDALLNLSSTPVENGELNQSLPNMEIEKPLKQKTFS